MPPGISTAPEQFQRCLDEEFEGLEGLTHITDDILVYDCGGTDKDARVDHNVNPEKLMERCVMRNIELNLTKTCIRQKQVKFLGHVFSSEVLKPDPAKNSAIINMPILEDKAGVHRLLGMVNYLKKLVPHLTPPDLTKHLRAHMRNDTEFLWDSNLDRVFNSVKTVLTEAPVLKYSDGKQPALLQADASQSGPGACLVQNVQQVAYVSGAITPTECNYTQIEKELLSFVFSMNRFDKYVYGHRVVVERDHTPLEAISSKSLYNARKHLQSMLLALQCYDIKLTYK